MHLGSAGTSTLLGRQHRQAARPVEPHCKTTIAASTPVMCASQALGIGATGDRASPVEVAGGVRFASLTAEARHSCGLAENGDATVGEATSTVSSAMARRSTVTDRSRYGADP